MTDTQTTDGETPTNVIESGGNLAPLKADIKKGVAAIQGLKAKPGNGGDTKH